MKIIRVSAVYFRVPMKY